MGAALRLPLQDFRKALGIDLPSFPSSDQRRDYNGVDYPLSETPDGYRKTVEVSAYRSGAISVRHCVVFPSGLVAGNCTIQGRVVSEEGGEQDVFVSEMSFCKEDDIPKLENPSLQQFSVVADAFRCAVENGGVIDPVKLLEQLAHVQSQGESRWVSERDLCRDL